MNTSLFIILSVLHEQNALDYSINPRPIVLQLPFKRKISAKNRQFLQILRRMTFDRLRIPQLLPDPKPAWRQFWVKSFLREKRSPENPQIFRNSFFHRQGRCGTRHLLFLLPAETAARRQKCILRFGPHSRENENREHPQMLPIFALSI